MVFRLLMLASLLGLAPAQADPGLLPEQVSADLRNAVNLLSKTELGKRELGEAGRARVPILPGPVSKTDVVATRRKGVDGEEITMESRVIIARDKDAVFQALDLAHELVHAIEPVKTNPFDPTLSPGDYVRSGIEGGGGEAEAIRSECAVGHEFFQSGAKLGIKAEVLNAIRARCSFAWEEGEDRSHWIRSFYDLGNFYSEFNSILSGLRIPASEKSRWGRATRPRTPLFASAVTHKPYPLALLEEYLQITRKVCGRAKARGSASRDPAMESPLGQRCGVLGIAL